MAFASGRRTGIRLVMGVSILSTMRVFAISRYGSFYYSLQRFGR
jgi:hypothetical protein